MLTIHKILNQITFPFQQVKGRQLNSFQLQVVAKKKEKIYFVPNYRLQPLYNETVLTNKSILH